MKSSTKPGLTSSVLIAIALIILASIVRSTLLKNEYLYRDVSASHLPTHTLGELSMAAAAADLDQDGDLDLIIANEHRPNIYLVNNGEGKFSNHSHRIPQVMRDSEDIAIADFDADGDLDIVVVSEDDQSNEFYLNDGNGNFSDGGDRIPVEGISNAVLAIDVDYDRDIDLIIGNNGQNRILLNDGGGIFHDDTENRLAAVADVTQSLAVGDLNGDGHPDLVCANEDANTLHLNNGEGIFVLAEASHLPLRKQPEESREVSLGDVDGDGDLDILFANVQVMVPGALRQNRLLLNSGDGHFIDATANLPADNDHSFSGSFFDIDQDGDLDIITGNTAGEQLDMKMPFKVYLNDGRAVFSEATAGVLPPSATGPGFDIEYADFNGDARIDIYLANRGSIDRLLLR